MLYFIGNDGMMTGVSLERVKKSKMLLHPSNTLTEEYAYRKISVANSSSYSIRARTACRSVADVFERLCNVQIHVLFDKSIAPRFPQIGLVN